MKALVRHIMVVHTSSRAAHHDPRTVILMGAACAGTWGGISSPVYVTSLTFVGSQPALHGTFNVTMEGFKPFHVCRCKLRWKGTQSCRSTEGITWQS